MEKVIVQKVVSPQVIQVKFSTGRTDTVSARHLSRAATDADSNEKNNDGNQIVRPEEQVDETLVESYIDQQHEEYGGRPQRERRDPEWMKDYVTLKKTVDECGMFVLNCNLF